MHEETPRCAQPVDDVLLWTDDSESFHLKAVTKDGDSVKLNAEEARALAKTLIDLAGDIDLQDELGLSALSTRGRGRSAINGEMSRPKFTVRDMLWSVGWFALGFAPISALLHGAGPISLLIVLSPCFIGAGIGALFQRMWSGFNWGLGVMLFLACLVPVLAIIVATIDWIIHH